MRKGWMNIYAKFSGAARRHFPAICEKPIGGTYYMCPPAVRGLTLVSGGGLFSSTTRVFHEYLPNGLSYDAEIF